MSISLASISANSPPTEATLSLTWSATLSVPISYSIYVVEEQTNHGNCEDVFIVVSNPLNVSDLSGNVLIVLGGLNPNTKYLAYGKVQLQNTDFLETTSTIAFQTTMEAPHIIVSSYSINNVIISIDDYDLSNCYYNSVPLRVQFVYSNGLQIQSQEFDYRVDNMYPLYNLVPNTQYWITCTLKNEAGYSNVSNTITATPSLVPMSSTNVSASLTSNTNHAGIITVSWNGPGNTTVANPIIQYDIFAMPVITGITGQPFQIGRQRLADDASGSPHSFEWSQADAGEYSPPVIGVTYEFYVVATNNVDLFSTSANSDNFLFETIPDAPLDVSANVSDSTNHNGAITITWSDPSNVAYQVTDYFIYADGVQIGTVSQASRSFTWHQTDHFGPVPNGNYTFTVKANNSEGPSSDSNTALVHYQTSPDAPTNVISTITGFTNGSGSITITWTAPDVSYKITGYEVYYADGQHYITTTNNTTSFTWSQHSDGLTPGLTYTFQVKAVNDVGPSVYSSSSAPLTFIIEPAAPTDVSANPTGSDGQLLVEWNPPANDGGAYITSYTIQYKKATDISWNQLDPLAPTTYTLTGLINGIVYDVQVSATNTSSLTGPWSDTAKGTPDTNPFPPTIQDIHPTYTDPSHNTTAVGLQLTWSNPAQPLGVAIDHYVITYYFVVASGVTPGAPNSGTITTENADTHFLFDCKTDGHLAGTNIGTGAYYTFSIVAVSTTKKESAASSGHAQAYTDPTTVFDASAVSKHTNSLHFLWADYVPVPGMGPQATGWAFDESRYSITCLDNNANPAGTITTTPTDASFATITNLTNGTTYTLRVTVSMYFYLGGSTTTAQVSSSPISGIPSGLPIYLGLPSVVAGIVTVQIDSNGAYMTGVSCLAFDNNGVPAQTILTDNSSNEIISRNLTYTFNYTTLPADGITNALIFASNINGMKPSVAGAPPTNQSVNIDALLQP